MKKFGLSKIVCGFLVFCAAAAIVSPAQTLTTLANFGGTDGTHPTAGLVDTSDGNFYGTTNAGGANGSGTVFEITPAGTLTTLHTFDSTDGSSPYAGLLQGTDGNFYGTTQNGGASNLCQNGCGTVFKITAGGVLSTLHSFKGTDGADPYARLVPGTDGNLYGTTAQGGTGDSCSYFQPPGCGTVFKITSSGTLTTLHNFNSTDGESPFAGLVQATDGNFYGTTAGGGANGGGTIFKLTPSGTLTTLYSFCSQPNCSDGSYPVGSLVQAADGNFYGPSLEGGASGNCYPGCGTVFKVTPGGTLTTLHKFHGTDGAYPYEALVQASDGNFYGTTAYGGANNVPACNHGNSVGCGTVFKITVGGTLTTLYTFSFTDGSDPAGALVQATDGNFYGTTYYGGANSCLGLGCGTVFSLSLPPSITIFTPRIGRVGTSVVITGGNLQGATSVSFGGTKAKRFTVESSTQIRATVPAGARTGKIGVSTPAGTAASAGTFAVL